MGNGMKTKQVLAAIERLERRIERQEALRDQRVRHLEIELGSGQPILSIPLPQGKDVYRFSLSAAGYEAVAIPARPFVVGPCDSDLGGSACRKGAGHSGFHVDRVGTQWS
jgi:hypothetical protein